VRTLLESALEQRQAVSLPVRRPARSLLDR
jgi:hypothetical protein